MLAAVRTKLPLYRWCQLMGINPLHFAQLTLPAYSEQRMGCNGQWYFENFQAADKVSRNELAEAIRRAEDDIERWLGYNLVPDWSVDERNNIERHYRPEWTSPYITNLRGYNSTVRTKAHFIAGGIKAKTLITASTAITWGAAHANDGYKRTGSVQVTVAAGTNPCELRAYYPGKSGNDLYEIRPIEVSISGTTATITFRRELAVLEDDQTDLFPEVLDGTDDTNFISTLDIYRVYNDPQTQVSFLWEQAGGVCTDGSGAPNEYVTQAGYLLARDNEVGIVGMAPGTWDATTSSFTSAGLDIGRVPDIARLYYLSGYQDMSLACPRVEMAHDLAQIVARYAASMLERPVCECDSSLRVEAWRQDLAFSGGAEEVSVFNIPGRQLDNPFGTRRGAVYVWSRLENQSIGVGAIVA